MTKYLSESELNRIIESYGDAMLRTANLYLCDPYLADDAVQDTFVKVYRNYATFKGESSEKTWITRILINTCKNYMRTNWHRKVDLSAIMPERAGTDSNAELELVSSIAKLPVKYREVILLYYYNGFKTKEIASILKCSESTVSVRLLRAKGMLRLELEEDENE